MSRVAEILKWVKDGEILDVGCTDHTLRFNSPHWIHGALRQRFQQVSGIDIEDTFIQQMRDQGYNNLYVMSAEDIHFPQKRFSTIVAGELIEHLGRPAAFLESAKAHLAPDGRIIITTPYPFALIFNLFALLAFPNTCFNQQHTCWFCPQTMRELVSRCGLEVEHFSLIPAYNPDSQSIAYRVFMRFMQGLSLILPKRLTCDTMFFVLKAKTDHSIQPHNR